MKWVPDPTGRFKERPHFTPEEIEATAASLVRDFHQAKYGRPFSPPWATGDLTCLIESRAESLDLYADLASEGPDVEGITSFVPRAKPRVEISRILSEDARLERRLRTTLTHECTHVVLHGPLWQLHWQRLAGPSLFASGGGEFRSVSHRDQMRGGGWMEWQAGYGCGAILMPKGLLLDAVKDARAKLGIGGALVARGPLAQRVTRLVAERFGTSIRAAEVRLEVLGLAQPPGMADQGELGLGWRQLALAGHVC